MNTPVLAITRLCNPLAQWQAIAARLNALENDNTAAEEAAGASDDEFDVGEESEDERSSASEDELRIGCAPPVAAHPSHDIYRF